MLDLPSFLYGAGTSVLLVAGWLYVDLHFGASPQQRAERKRLKMARKYEARR